MATTFPIPPRDLESRDRIIFRHPGYPVERNSLLLLPRVDAASAASSATDPTTYGVHHRTALLACQIIANNAFDGYLTLDQAGQHLVNVLLDDILIENEYYFVAGDSPGIPLCFIL
jgi:hypothetical protein